MTPSEQKRALRDKLRTMRRLIGPDEKREKDIALFERQKRFIFETKPPLVLSYISTPEEADTRRLIDFCFENNITIAAPRCEGRAMRFCIIRSAEDLEQGKFGILEPKKECKQADISENALCFVPGLAFDNKGYRLGYGGGFYDRFLSEHKVSTVGICYKEYIFERLPTDKFDKAVELVITD